MSDTTLGMIVVASLLVGALLAGAIGLGRPSRKEIGEEARKRLVGKFAEEKATAQFDKMKKGGSAVRLIVIALALGGLVYAIVVNMDRKEASPHPLPAPATVPVGGSTP